jgi:NAD(P)H-hydrate repair Nnr-like enzyme with NAD(P)H-hydrate dehydratase domain
MARGLSPADAATAAAYAHGIAGRLAGETLGEGTTASDVALHLAPALAELAEPET